MPTTLQTTEGYWFLKLRFFRICFYHTFKPGLNWGLYKRINNNSTELRIMDKCIWFTYCPLSDQLLGACALSWLLKKTRLCADFRSKRWTNSKTLSKLRKFHLVVLRETLFRLHFHGSPLHSSQLRVRSRGVRYNSSGVGNSEEE